MAFWLAQIRARGWTSYLSEPRYSLVILREQAARGLARRDRADPDKEQLLDFLFPGDQPQGRGARHQHLPDELFSVVVRYYWCGEP